MTRILQVGPAWRTLPGRGRRDMAGEVRETGSVSRTLVNQGQVREDLTGWEVWEEPCFGQQGIGPPKSRTNEGPQVGQTWQGQAAVWRSV